MFLGNSIPLFLGILQPLLTPVVVPNEQGQYELTILKDNGLQGYALRYKATGGTIVKWYADGMLYTLGGELPVETLVEIAKSVR
ncbi:MAG TPA: DUF4367 domain-containing protein [Thermaerobacter sp.]